MFIVPLEHETVAELSHWMPIVRANLAKFKVRPLKLEALHTAQNELVSTCIHVELVASKLCVVAK